MGKFLYRHHRKVVYLLLSGFAFLFVSSVVRAYYYSYPLLAGKYEYASKEAFLRTTEETDDDAVEKGFQKLTAYEKCIYKSVEIATGYVDLVSGDRVIAKYDNGLTMYEDAKYGFAKVELEKAYAACCDKNGKVRTGYENLASEMMLLAGNAMWNDGKMMEAAPFYELALKLNPDNLVAAYNLEKLQASKKGGGKGGSNAPRARI